MNIQSLSIVVPNPNCINNCRFCVSRMHCDEFENNIENGNLRDDPRNLAEKVFNDDITLYEGKIPDKIFNLLKFNRDDIYIKDYIKRLNFARDNGCNTVMLTGTSEPQQNKNFLKFFAETNEKLDKPFRWIELQTTGVLLDEEYLKFLREEVCINTISVSISAFEDSVNIDYTRMPEKCAVNLKELCKNIKKMGFNLRLSVNLTDYFNKYKDNVTKFFEDAKEMFNPDQLTLRVLYASDDESEQATWVRAHACDFEIVKQMIENIKNNGTALERLPYGRIKYSYYGMSLVIDDDCMSKESVEDYKYLILRPNCKLYSRWDDMASLIF